MDDYGDDDDDDDGILIISPYFTTPCVFSNNDINKY